MIFLKVGMHKCSKNTIDSTWMQASEGLDL